MKRLPIGILGSGKGSNCRAILERIRSGELAADARVVISDALEAPILDIAREFSVANAYLPPGQFRTRLEPEVENELVNMLREAGVHLVVLAGFMRVLSPWFVARWNGRLINIHPSLLPAFKGLHTHERAIAAGAKEHGATVHLVVSELDSGPIIEQASVPVLPGDTPASLAARVLEVEHRIYPRALRRVAEVLGQMDATDVRALAMTRTK